MAESFVMVHRSEHVSEGWRRRRSVSLSQHLHELNKKEETEHVVDDLFTLAEMVRAIKRAKPTSPGKD